MFTLMVFKNQKVYMRYLLPKIHSTRLVYLFMPNPVYVFSIPLYKSALLEFEEQGNKGTRCVTSRKTGRPKGHLKKRKITKYTKEASMLSNQL